MDNIAAGQLRVWTNTYSDSDTGNTLLVVGRVPDNEVGGDVWWNYIENGEGFTAPEGVLLDHSEPS